jgi:hypothetical protein
MATSCEDQRILLEIYKFYVASYSRAVKALGETKKIPGNDFLRSCDATQEALESCFIILRSLNDHVRMHGCRLESNALLIED